MVQFKVNRGNESDLPILLTDGWVYFCTDTGNVYFDWQDGENVRRTQMNAKYADIIRYHDGSDYIDIDPAEIALKNDIPKIDNTLTADGQAADAKAVGDELNKKISAPSTASVGQALRVKTVDENGMPTEWETADVSETGTASIDPTLTKEGFAADAKAVGDELGGKADKALRVVITIVDVQNGLYNSSHNLQEIMDHVNNGGYAFCDYGGRIFNLTSVNEYGATFHSNSVVDHQSLMQAFTIDRSGEVKFRQDTHHDGVMYVNVDFWSEYTKDRYFSEIKDHYDSGGSVVVLFNNNHWGTGKRVAFDIYDVISQEMRFFRTHNYEQYPGSYVNATEIITIKSDETVSMSSVSVPKAYQVEQHNNKSVSSGAVYDYAVPIPDEIAVGQAVVVEALDENGRPAAWKAVDMASGGASSRMYINVRNWNGTISKDRTFAEIKSHHDNGGSIELLYENVNAANGNSRYELNSIDNTAIVFYKTWVAQNTGDIYSVSTNCITIKPDESVSLSCVEYPRAIEVRQWSNKPVTGDAVYNYAVPIPATAEVGQVLSVKAVDDNGKPTEWEPVDMSGGGAVNIDPTLTVEGAAADAKAVGDALSEKASKELRVTISYDDSWNEVSNYSPSEILEHFNNGGSVRCSYSEYGDFSLMNINETEATFKAASVTRTNDTSVFLEQTYIYIESDKKVRISYSSFQLVPDNEIKEYNDTRYITGKAVYNYAVPIPASASVGNALVVKSVDENGKPTAWETANLSGGALNKMYVNVRTSSGFAGLSKDRTFEEIKNHIDNGGEVEVLYYNSMTGLLTKYNYALYSVDDSEIQFSSTNVSNYYGDYYGVSTYIISIKSDDSISGKVVEYPRTNEVKEYCHIPVESDAVYNYAVPIPETAEVGQALVVKTVDENGKPTEWEAADLSGGSETSGAMYVTVSNGTAGIRKDRTFAEMKSHYDNGNRVVVLYYEPMSGSSTKYIFEIYSVDDSKMQFSRTRVFNMYDDLYSVNTEIITIQSDETVSMSTVTYQHKHNMDAELSDSSDNAVQNKVVTAALAQKSQVQIITWEDDD